MCYVTLFRWVRLLSVCSLHEFKGHMFDLVGCLRFVFVVEKYSLCGSESLNPSIFGKAKSCITNLETKGTNNHQQKYKTLNH